MNLVNNSWARNWVELPADGILDTIRKRHAKHKFLG